MSPPICPFCPWLDSAAYVGWLRNFRIAYIWMGPNPNGPLSELRSSYYIFRLFWVRSVGPVGDFLEWGFLIRKRWWENDTSHKYDQPKECTMKGQSLELVIHLSTLCFSWSSVEYETSHLFFFLKTYGNSNRCRKYVEHTLPETNIAPEIGPSQKEIHLPTIHFQGQTVSFREGIWRNMENLNLVMIATPNPISQATVLRWWCETLHHDLKKKAVPGMCMAYVEEMYGNVW